MIASTTHSPCSFEPNTRGSPSPHRDPLVRGPALDRGDLRLVNAADAHVDVLAGVRRVGPVAELPLARGVDDAIARRGPASGGYESAATEDPVGSELCLHDEPVRLGPHVGEREEVEVRVPLSVADTQEVSDRPAEDGAARDVGGPVFVLDESRGAARTRCSS